MIEVKHIETIEDGITIDKRIHILQEREGIFPNKYFYLTIEEAQELYQKLGEKLK